MKILGCSVGASIKPFFVTLNKWPHMEENTLDVNKGSSCTIMEPTDQEDNENEVHPGVVGSKLALVIKAFSIVAQEVEGVMFLRSILLDQNHLFIYY